MIEMYNTIRKGIVTLGSLVGVAGPAYAQTYCPANRPTTVSYSGHTETITAYPIIINKKASYAPGEMMYVATDLAASLPVTHSDVAVWISPLNQLPNTQQRILFAGDNAAFTPAIQFLYDSENPDMRQGRILPKNLAPGDYAVFTSGNFTMNGNKYELTRMSCDTFTIAGATAPESDLISFYEGIGFDVRSGRYGANKADPKKKNWYPYEGIVRVQNSDDLRTSSTNLSRNFEFKVRETQVDDFLTSLSRERITANVRGDSYGTIYVETTTGDVYREALLGVHLALGKRDPWDIGKHDVDAHADISGLEVLAFNRPYELKQSAVRNGVGRSSHMNNIPVNGTYQAEGTEGIAPPIDRPDEGWLIKVAYNDADNDGVFNKNSDLIIGIDMIGWGVHNKAPNASLVALSAYATGVLTGFGIRSLLEQSDDITPEIETEPPVENVPGPGAQFYPGESVDVVEPR